MKNVGITVFIILIVAIVVVFAVSFQVRETELVVVTRFGQPQRPITEPGWYRRWPSPIERVHRFDSRLRLYEGVLEETTTKGGEPIIVTSYIVWKITEPLKFLETVETVDGAEDRLYSQLRDVQNKVIGRHYFSEFVNTEPERIKFEQIENEMFSVLGQQVQETYGIEVKTVGIKKLGVSEKVTEDVFARMRADREHIATAIISQGTATAKKIEDEANAKKSKLLDTAEARAKAIRGRGDAEAAEYYKMLEANEELAMFLRDLEVLKKILRQRSTIVLSGQSEPFNLLKKMPDIKPAQ